MENSVEISVEKIRLAYLEMPLRTSGVRKTRKKSRYFLVITVISGFTKLLRNTQNSDMNKFKVGK